MGANGWRFCLVAKHLRQRGVAVVRRRRKVLLVRDRGKHRFSLPGGGLKKGERTVRAAARELREELGLKAVKVRRMQQCDFKGAASLHRVCLVEAIGQPHLRSHELDKYIWLNFFQSYFFTINYILLRLILDIKCS